MPRTQGGRGGKVAKRPFYPHCASGDYRSGEVTNTQGVPSPAGKTEAVIAGE